VFAALFVLAGTAGARDDRSADTTESLANHAQREAIRRGLAWIAAHQKSGGMWGEVQDTQIADTALSLLALMAGGSTLGPGVPTERGLVAGPTKRGPYADAVEAGLRFLANRAAFDHPPDPPGYIAGNDQNSQMHGHGFATLALASASGNLGSGRVAAVRDAVRNGREPNQLDFADLVRYGLWRAVQCTEAAQDKDTGGWTYSPMGGGHEGSMTVTQVLALRAAQDAGVPVTKKVIDHAYEYLRKSQNLQHRDLYGGFAYQQQQKERVSLALTSAALTTLFGLGRYGEAHAEDRKIIEDALGYVDRRFEEDYNDTSRSEWYYYRLFYLVQAIYLSTDDARDVRIRRYWPRIRNAVLEWQNADGSFKNSPDAQRSPEYCTAMGCLILQVPLETLPIFQRR
jgi:hypothetical protein